MGAPAALSCAFRRRSRFQGWHFPVQGAACHRTIFGRHRPHIRYPGHCTRPDGSWGHSPARIPQSGKEVEQSHPHAPDRMGTNHCHPLSGGPAGQRSPHGQTPSGAGQDLHRLSRPGPGNWLCDGIRHARIRCTFHRRTSRTAAYRLRYKPGIANLPEPWRSTKACSSAKRMHTEHRSTIWQPSRDDCNSYRLPMHEQGWLPITNA